MTSNFDFLQTNHNPIYENAVNAEKNGIIDPRVSCMYARFTLEAVLKWMYDHDEDLKKPWEDSLNAMLRESSFTHFAPPHILKSCELIRRQGNASVHDTRKIPSQTSIFVVQSLHNVLYWFFRLYYDSNLKSTFNPAIIPTGKEIETSLTRATELEQKAIKQEQEYNQKFLLMDQELKELREQVAAHKRTTSSIPDAHDYSEAETRKRFVDLLLREAGWEIGQADVHIEYELTGVKRNKSGIGYADYVLFGDDGLPLAVVEAKKCMLDPVEGKYQAEDYADAIEAKFGQRPIIFYTNGYETHIWDDQFYPPEEIQGFYKKDELQRLINRRSNRIDLTTVPVDKKVAGRPYQTLAIKSIADHLMSRHRRALLVMATGTGKTRTTIAMIKLLQQANWAKRVLFLCDRISLLNQAKKAFIEHLPDTPAVDLRTNKDDTTSRLCLSTYGTMVGLIDEIKNGKRLFGAGHFDLIVIDEAHLSVYQKYGAIFDYFNSILVGLTATPREEVDKNTYQLFRMEDGVPCFNYPLEEAVDEEFLVYFKAMKTGSQLVREGLTYSTLSDDEKEEYELHFSDEDTGMLPEKIQGNALNDWLFNIETADGFLKQLMESGIKVQGGDILGKTIIFAKNKDHAEFIVKRFDANYPEYAGKFCIRIDYTMGKDAETQIDKFKGKGYPQIAVSVDMLDTGIDVPEVVNLVLAKPVYSKTKFWQMIGRGTRLCPNLFGPDDDKEFFLVFDCCSNFEFFEQTPEGVEGKATERLSQRIFNTYLTLAHDLSGSTDDDAQKIRTESLNFLHEYVTQMNRDNFIIRPNLRFVDKYSKRDSWDALDVPMVSEISQMIAPLPSTIEMDDEEAKRWDLLVLKTQVALVEGLPLYQPNMVKIQKIAAELCKLTTLPEVKKHIEFIESVSTHSFWEDMNLVILDQIRKKLRLLIKYIEKGKKKIVYSTFSDVHEEVREISTEYLTSNDLAQYRKKVESIINQMEADNHITIHKIKHNKPITDLDLKELERVLADADVDRDQFQQIFGRQVMKKWQDISNPPLSLLIRSIVGLAREDVEVIFADFIDQSALSTSQYRFIQQLINHMTQDGFISPATLYEPPYSDIDHGGPDEVFGDKADNLFELINLVNQRAMGGA